MYRTILQIICQKYIVKSIIEKMILPEVKGTLMMKETVKLLE